MSGCNEPNNDHSMQYFRFFVNECNMQYLHGNSGFEELKWLPCMSVTFIAGLEGEPTEVLVSLVEALNEALEVRFFVEGFWKI